MIRVLAVALLTTVGVAQCRKPGIPAADVTTAPPPIQELATEITRPGISVIQVTTKRFGPPARLVASGALQWRAPGGMLIFDSGRMRYQTDHGPIWLIDDPTTAITVLMSRPFEMTAQGDPPPHRIGTLRLNKNARYQFTDALDNSNQHESESDNFFLGHPKGTFVIQFAEGCMPTTILETQPDKAIIGEVILTPAGGAKPESFRIISSRTEHRLSLVGKHSEKFKLETGNQDAPSPQR